jgi:hypothetical protein
MSTHKEAGVPISDTPQAAYSSKSGTIDSSDSELSKSIDWVRSIIEHFGPRSPGSEAEELAQNWIAEKWSTFGNVSQQTFKAALTAKFHSLKIFSLLFWAGLALVFWNPAFALAIGIINAIVYLGHFVTYRDWLDPIYPQIESQNVELTLEPQAEVRNTLLFAGHMDSATEFRWWYWFGQTGLVMTVLGGVVISFGFLLWVPALLQDLDFAAWNAGAICWLISAALSLLLLSSFFLHGDRVVDGAIDNLSAVAICARLAQELTADQDTKGKTALQHTRIRLISFGSEECGLKGSQAYVKKHANRLKSESAHLINLESFRDAQAIQVLQKEIFTMVQYPQPLVEEVLSAFKEKDVPAIPSFLPIGATDASSFAWADIPATCLIGLSSDKLDPTYHTRRDNLEHIDPEGMEKVLGVMLHFIQRWDQNLIASES